MDRLTFAKFYATQHHGDQRYGVLPYTHHLADVEAVLRRFNPLPHIPLVADLDGPTEEDMLVSAWLHDIVEDTDVKARDIEENFGEWVFKLVSAVTSEPGESRKVRNALTYPKIRSTGIYAVRLKLADRIANVQNKGGSLKMYQKEYPDFRHALYTQGENQDMWSVLDRIL